MIYQPKPQRSGRSIPVNENYPPQDPPPPPVDVSEIIPVEVPVIDVVEIPEITKLIRIDKVKVIASKVIAPKKIISVPSKLTILQKISKFFKKIFRRI